MKKVIILMGPPGSGKGTHAEMMKRAYNIAHLSTGDMLRAEVANNTALGQKIQTTIDQGILVSDELMNELVANRIKKVDCNNGFILDGYPRTLNQAESLDEVFADNNIIDYKVLELKVGKELLVKRVLGRFTCITCGTIYNEYFYPPKVVNICDVCGGNNFTKRKDDNLETITERLRVYEEQTTPVLGYYKNNKKYYRVDGSLSKEEVETEINNLIY